MANLIFDKAQIEATIDKIVDRTMRMDMTWDWPCGVAYYGICEAYEVTKNERYLQLVKDRVDEYIELGLPSWTVNTCSMGHCLSPCMSIPVMKSIWTSPKARSSIWKKKRCASGIMFCSTPSRSTTTSPSRRGRIRSLWRASSCCGWACF